MATWTIYKKLNVSPNSFPLVIPIKQYSSDFSLKFKLYSTEGDLDIEAGATTKIRGTKRDGNGFELTGTRIGNTCTFSGTKAQMQQMTAAHGRCVFEIVIENNTRELITANFYLEVQRAAMDAETVTSESIIEEFTDFQSKITAAQAQADRAEAAAESIDFGIDPTLSQSGQAADAFVTGTLKDDNPNLFFASNTISRSMYGVTISFDKDDNVTFDGVSTGKLRYTIRGAVTTSDISLPAGTYVFSRELISGTASKNPFLAVDDHAVELDTEVTFTEDTAVYIQINKGYTLSNVKYRFSIRKAGFTANDKTVRSLVKKKSIKILGIGNSYTRDSLRWLSGILMRAGYNEVIVGHGYIGSITLAEQYASLNTSDANYSAYTYYKYINNDHQYTKDGKTLEEVITSELWDVVIFQQQSDEAGQYSSFVSSNFDINDFVSYVKTAIGNDNLKIGIALTWSHAHGYTGEKFVQYYGGDPTIQYDAIKQTIPQVANHMSQCDFIVNVGDAVEYGRDNTYLSTLGTELLRTDKNHLYYGIPSYMAGMVYAMTMCGINGTESTWYPTAADEGVSDVVTSANYARIARQCAKKAVMEVI